MHESGDVRVVFHPCATAVVAIAGTEVAGIDLGRVALPGTRRADTSEEPSFQRRARVLEFLVFVLVFHCIRYAFASQLRGGVGKAVHLVEVIEREVQGVPEGRVATITMRVVHDLRRCGTPERLWMWRCTRGSCLGSRL